MDFNLSDEQQMLQEGVARYVREQYAFEARRKSVAAGGYSPQQWTTFADMGWLALEIPEGLGGLGLDFVELALVAEELGRGLVLEPFSHVTAVTAHLLAGAAGATGAAAVAALAALEQVAAGTRQILPALNEPGARYSLSPALTRAVPDGSSGWRLSGIKQMVPLAPLASEFIVSAVLPDQDLALFLVPAQAAGVTVMPYRLIDGSVAGDLEIRDLAVGGDALLLQGTAAVHRLDEAGDRAGIAMVAEGLGVAEAVMAMTSEYIKTRQQFGQPIGKFQALQHRMAEMFVEVQALRSILLRAIASLDQPAQQRAAAVSAAKVMFADTVRLVGGQGIQLHGAIGLTEEYPVGHCYKRMLVLERLYGDADFHMTRFMASGQAS